MEALLLVVGRWGIGPALHAIVQYQKGKNKRRSIPNEYMSLLRCDWKFKKLRVTVWVVNKAAMRHRGRDPL